MVLAEEGQEKTLKAHEDLWNIIPNLLFYMNENHDSTVFPAT